MACAILTKLRRFIGITIMFNCLQDARSAYAGISVIPGSNFEVFRFAEVTRCINETNFCVECRTPKTKSFTQFRNINAPQGCNPWAIITLFIVFGACHGQLNIKVWGDSLNGFRSYEGLKLGVRFLQIFSAL